MVILPGCSTVPARKTGKPAMHHQLGVSWASTHTLTDRPSAPWLTATPVQGTEPSSFDPDGGLTAGWACRGSDRSHMVIRGTVGTSTEATPLHRYRSPLPTVLPAASESTIRLVSTI